ncbi:MAG: alpha/beta hydrolase [Microscillaceae bacterium]|jgi:pimeloyl-ACP methyl ester carboxylesterase|nr:alpha/beta hydrolase [Microscillaceae bacterium]
MSINYTLIRVLWGIFLLIHLASCIKFRRSDAEYQKVFKDQIPYQIHRYTALKREIRYIEIGQDSLPTLFFIHGSPSSSSVYLPYYQDSLLCKNFKMIGVDRPGYGYSGFGKAEASIQQQVAMIKSILENPRLQRPIILVGASYGGPVAAKLAMDYPELVDGIVWISPAIGPGLEKIYGISYLIRYKMFSWLAPTMLQVANVEKLAHRSELQKMLPDWTKIKAPVSHFHGDEDELVYLENVEFARQNLVNVPWYESIVIPGGRHFLQWEYKPLIIKQIFKHLQDYQSSQTQSIIKIKVKLD